MHLLVSTLFGWIIGAMVSATMDYAMNPASIFHKGNKGMAYTVAAFEIGIIVTVLHSISDRLNRNVNVAMYRGWENFGFFTAATLMAPSCWLALTNAYYDFHQVLYGEVPVASPFTSAITVKPEAGEDTGNDSEEETSQIKLY